ncbi:hypothetical protein CYMTET_6950 [Cymbomonas tetramitiformis]|uniref:RNase H type-1 domain-containing protein n=1 Tax=Cymbomonas tetramitiformis TaxID=36881 RepID=A0AAE0GWF1_9CHLO|nr:hypothetical protein CYMTET_6950 [Cymbomonas tetramitiformis]
MRNEVKICTDNANSLHQINNMRARPYMMERHQHRDTLHEIMGTIEKLNAAGTAVELYKVKAHVGIIGNEGADEAAKEACEKGRMVPNTENSDTVTLQALLDQGREEERMEEEEEVVGTEENNHTNEIRNRERGEREGIEAEVDPQQEEEEIMRAIEGE